MKKIVFLLTTFLVTSQINAQIDITQLDSLINDTREKVKKTNNQILYKTLYDYRGYPLGNETISDEWLAVLYFDSKGVLKKTKLIFTSLEGYYIHYYSNKVMIAQFFSFYSAARDGSYSFLKYLTENEELLKLDCIKTDIENNNQLVEHIVRKGGYENVNECDVKIHSTDDIASFFDINKISKPKEIIPVKFVKPKPGDITIINDNSINLRKDASTLYSPIMQLNVGSKVKVLDFENGWYKVKHTSANNEVIGFVYQDFLEPIEQIIEE